MIKRRIPCIQTMAVAILLLGSTTLYAMAQDIVDFNDFGPSAVGVHMPASYAGFAWATSDWHYMSTVNAPDNTFLALSGSATHIRRTDGAAFYFDSADFWSRRGLDAKGDFYFVFYYKGNTVYNGKALKVKTRFTGTPTTFNSPYTGLVDGIAIAFDKPGRGGDWDHLAMDNLITRQGP